MATDDTITARWSRTAQILALAVVAELAAAGAIIAFTELHRPRILVVVAALAIGSALLVARAHMPAPIKAGLIAMICVALLATAGTVDAFGLRAIDHAVATATDAPSNAAPDSQNATSIAARVSLRGSGDADAAAFADELSHNVVAAATNDAGLYRVDGLVDVDSGIAGDAYHITWSLGRAGDTVWCGRIVAVGQDRKAALAKFGMAIATALRRKPDAPLACA